MLTTVTKVGGKGAEKLLTIIISPALFLKSLVYYIETTYCQFFPFNRKKAPDLGE